MKNYYRNVCLSSRSRGIKRSNSQLRWKRIATTLTRWLRGLTPTRALIGAREGGGGWKRCRRICRENNGASVAGSRLKLLREACFSRLCCPIRRVARVRYRERVAFRRVGFVENEARCRYYFRGGNVSKRGGASFADGSSCADRLFTGN